MPAYSFLYSLPYLVILFLLLYLYIKEQRNRIMVGRYAFVILLLFVGLRGHIFTDYTSYYPFFEDTPTILNLEFEGLFTGNFEFGFILYSSLIKTIIPNYFCWVFINTLIDLLIIYWLFKKYSTSVVLSFILFFAFQGLTIEANLYRNSKAMMLFFLSIPFLKERKLVPYFLLNMTGCLFHLTSFLYLPVYFILTKRFSNKILWGGFLFVNILFFFNISLTNYFIQFVTPLLGIERMADKAMGYMMNAENYGFSFGYLERTFAFILFAFFYKKLQEKSDYNRIFCNCSFLYYITFYLFTDVSAFAERIPILFVFSYWLLYPNVLSLINRRSNRRVLLCVILLLCCMKIVTSNSNIMSMYDNLIFGVDSFEERMSIFRKYYEGMMN